MARTLRFVPMVITLGPRGRQTLSTSTPCVRRRRSSTGTTPIPFPCLFFFLKNLPMPFVWRLGQRTEGPEEISEPASPSQSQSVIPIINQRRASTCDRGGAHVSGGEAAAARACGWLWKASTCPASAAMDHGRRTRRAGRGPSRSRSRRHMRSAARPPREQ